MSGDSSTKPHQFLSCHQLFCILFFAKAHVSQPSKNSSCSLSGVHGLETSPLMYHLQLLFMSSMSLILIFHSAYLLWFQGATTT